ncbi:hypothetical protein KFL_003290100 [Klebsormidium nitens]|uniref:Macrocin O-methyltransferase n=1 Tax=Klebsormidium nitens TaxID=105231 RepID=A0A1Y1I953_KLENI|nr:hypothetical protein KFL_003290100 [Klebsormidium nitens]|eukprot:GAQ87073.1 hypothetical protein KFL_003290100 [Klebsormidium nitens]
MLSLKGDSNSRLAKILTVCFCLLTLIVLFRLVGAVLVPQAGSHNPLLPAQSSSLGAADSSSALAGVDAKVSQVLQLLQANPALPAGVQSGLPAGAGTDGADMIDRYLTLLATTLTGIVYRRPVFGAYGGTDDVPLERVPFNEAAAAEGLVWPDVGHTMVGLKRLANTRLLLETVLKEDIPGDFLEAGVWRGGSCIFARAVLDVYKSKRLVHVCDSFEGLPAASSVKDNDSWSRVNFLRVAKEQVQEHFKSYNMLNERVLFHKGFFRDSLPTAPVSQLAVIRADGDMYESTMDILFNLYEKLSVGGYVVIDDWGIPEAQEAVWDFAKWHGFTDDVKNLVRIDQSAIYWKKVKETKVRMELYQDFNSIRTPGKTAGAQ